MARFPLLLLLVRVADVGLVHGGVSLHAAAKHRRGLDARHFLIRMVVVLAARISHRVHLTLASDGAGESLDEPIDERVRRRRRGCVPRDDGRRCRALHRYELYRKNYVRAEVVNVALAGLVCFPIVSFFSPYIYI